MDTKTLRAFVVGLLLASVFPGPAAAATPTPTPIPWLAAFPTAGPGESRHAFHLNFRIDTTARCNPGVACDSFVVDTIVLYLRGDVIVGRNGAVTGRGMLRAPDLTPCRTLRPDLSSCRMAFAADGAFSVEGAAVGDPANPDMLEVILHLQQSPRFSGTHDTRHPVQGAISLPAGDTVTFQVKKLLENAGVFEQILELPPLRDGKSVPGPTVRGTFSQGIHSLKGFGGFFCISPETALP